MRTSKNKPVLTIHQATAGASASVTRGSLAPFDGWSSSKYEIKTAADALRFTSIGTEAAFVTLLASGPHAASEAASIVARSEAGHRLLSVETATRTYDVDIGGFGTPGETITVTEAAK